MIEFTFVMIKPNIMNKEKAEREQIIKNILSRYIEAGETLNFGGLLGYGPVMPLRKGSPAEFINRGGRIPAPLQALKN